MKKLLLILWLGVWLCPARAQDEIPSLEDMLDTGEQWLKDNIQDDVLQALPQLDRDKLKGYIDDLETRLQDPDVRGLAPWRQIATNALPVLEHYEETQPYAAWIRAHLDYFDVAEQFQRTAPVVEPGKTPSAPTPEFQRKAWQQQVQKRAVPKSAERYLPQLKTIFIAEKTPVELIWVAEVESGFDPAARSPSGAVGLFQLMPVTAKNLGLSTGWLRDERTNPEKNARAAAKYMNYLRQKFKNWPLALAAYNAGEGTVQKLLDKSKVKRFEAIAPRLPSETQLYVPKINATLMKREGVSLADLS
jgi:membrane-bound lytic murein transglycosylase D